MNKMLLLILLTFPVSGSMKVVSTNETPQIEMTETVDGFGDQRYKMSVCFNQQGDVCFRCALPGSECSLTNTHCFEVEMN